MKFNKTILGTAFCILSIGVSATVYQSHYYQYYSDASKTTPVGFSQSSCSTSMTLQEGEVTPYFTATHTDCASSEPGKFCDYYPYDSSCKYTFPKGNPVPNP
ncbi:MAG: hypothetical protein HRT54_16325 [Colwellia sp.]|nr:hypothetical protein [Colwellia sp.]